MAYEDYHVNADDVKLDGDPNIRRTVPPSPSGSGGGIAYGTCTTAAATAAKVVTLADATGWELKQGASVAVKFSNTNTFSATAQDPVTLNVNNTGAKKIYYGGSANPTGTNSTAFGRANYINTYVYDGTYWVWTGSSADNNTTYSAMSKSELTTGTATTSRVVRADYLKQGIEQIAESGAIDTANNTATFTSSDTTDANATSWTSVTKLASGESHKSIFAKMSQMFKNIRYLYKMLGTTDISSIGDGTVTGGLDTLKDALSNVTSVQVTPNSSYINNSQLTCLKNGFMVSFTGWVNIKSTVPLDGTTLFSNMPQKNSLYGDVNLKCFLVGENNKVYQLRFERDHLETDYNTTTIPTGGYRVNLVYFL